MTQANSDPSNSATITCVICSHTQANGDIKTMFANKDTVENVKKNIRGNGICNKCVKLCIDWMFATKANELKQSIDIKHSYDAQTVGTEK